LLDGKIVVGHALWNDLAVSDHLRALAGAPPGLASFLVFPAARRLKLDTADREAPTSIRRHARYLAVPPSPAARFGREGRGSAESQARDQGGSRKGRAAGVSLPGASVLTPAITWFISQVAVHVELR
jgi:hypothetical protein